MASADPAAPFDLTGHVALVTGGNGGIGLGYARGLARAGASVAIGRHDIQANAVLPGWIETDAPGPAVAYEKLYHTIVHRTPAHRGGQPNDLEGIAVYLASEASRFHTGDVLAVDGGYVLF